MDDKWINNPNRENSKLGQWITDNLPVTFFWCDIDGVVYKKSTRVLRIVEWKYPGQRLSKGQSTILPLLSKGINVLITMRILHPQSGVYGLWGEPPFDSAVIQQMGGERLSLNHRQFRQFVSGEQIDILSRAS